MADRHEGHQVNEVHMYYIYPEMFAFAVDTFSELRDERVSHGSSTHTV